MTHFQATTSAFGRRMVTRAQIGAQIAVKQARAAAQTRAAEAAGEAGADRPGAGQGGAVHKWTLLRTLSEIRDGLGVSDRALGVLSALLSFHPETALTLDATAQAAELIVFPSNRALGLRANGMSEPTLRRHLAALVEAGLIIRRDSPNGKRFARREADGESVAQAFGFDLSPLVARAGEFETRLEALRAGQRRVRFLKERINLLRRDLTKRIAFALDEGLPGPWGELRLAFLSLCTPLRRVRDLAGLDLLGQGLEALQDEVAQALEAAMRRPTPAAPESLRNPDGNGAQNERHMTESNPHQFHDLEPDAERAGGEDEPDGPSPEPSGKARRGADPRRELPLGLVLEACPDMSDHDFSGGKLQTWRAFVDVAAAVRPMLGISPDAWREAIDVMGEKNAAVAVAFILQRCEHASGASRHVGPDGRVAITVAGAPAIRSPGGYLRALSQKSREEPLSLWGAILAQLGQRVRVRRTSGAG